MMQRLWDVKKNQRASSRCLFLEWASTCFNELEGGRWLTPNCIELLNALRELLTGSIRL